MYEYLKRPLNLDGTFAATPKTIEIEFPYKFELRPYQKDFFRAMRTKKRAVLVWHRRSGKEKCCWNFLIKEAVKLKGVYYYFFPTFSQGRKVLWQFIDKDGFRVLDHIPKQFIKGEPNSSEMKIELKNGSIIQIIGTNNYDSIVGTNPMGCVFSEYSLQDPMAWTLVRPILAENGGWSIFNFTPRGNNWAKDLFDMAYGNPEWFVQKLTVEDTILECGSRCIPESAIETERAAGMSEDFIQQEFFCSFSLGIEGSYYAKYIQEMREEYRIGRVVWDRQQKVHTAWDLGYGDSTAIVFYQLVGNEIHVIDYYENHGESIVHYIQWMRKLPYIYGDHFAPHDVESHSLASGFSCKSVAANLGVNFIVLPTLRTRVEDGIEATRGILPRCWIDEKKCERLVKCLTNYRKEFDSIHNCYKMRPLHDEWSHGADSFRYMALAIKRFNDITGGITDEEVERLMDTHRPIFNV
jgi:hypothetical protein